MGEIALEVEKLEHRLEAVTNALRKLTDDVTDLMESSEGVIGLHQNGDVAPWSEITYGGRFESWLASHDAAEDVLKKNGYRIFIK